MATKAPFQATFPIDFIIVGGGLSGLATALSLQRVGHNVTVLERDAAIPNSGAGGGCKLTPNMTKIFTRWGLKPELQARGARMRTVVFNTEKEEPLGRHTYHDEVLVESGGGEWCFISHADIRGILFTAAVSLGVNVRTNCNVIAVDPSRRQVTLADGETVKGDVLVGADGPKGLCKELVTGHPTQSTPMGLSFYNATISAEAVARTPRLRGGEKATENPRGDHALHVYGPDDGQDGTWSDAPSVDLQDVLKSEPGLAKLVEGASHAVRLRMHDYERLEDWVHGPSERLILIGETVHPEPIGALQAAAMCSEDAAVLGKLFSHLQSEDQIGDMLWGFQDIRQERCKMALNRELERARLFTLKKGPEEEERDDSFRRLSYDNIWDSEFYSLDEPRVLFAYDCEDQGEEWWQSWGLLRERAKDRKVDPLKVTMHVEINKADTT